jgi:hypothetical protein
MREFIVALLVVWAVAVGYAAAEVMMPEMQAAEAIRLMEEQQARLAEAQAEAEQRPAPPVLVYPNPLDEIWTATVSGSVM